MKGRVLAERLNVRSMPGSVGSIVGVLTGKTVVNTLSCVNNWHEIRFNGRAGFVYGDYIEPVEDEKIFKGRVLATRLNVRDRPGISGERVGELAKNSIVDVVEEDGEWLEIGFNDRSAFVHRDYVELIEADPEKVGSVRADLLNVRRSPELSGEVVGSLKGGTEIKLLSRVGNWYEIRFNDSTAFVHADFLEVREKGATAPTGIVEQENGAGSASEEGELEPQTRLPLSGSSTEKKVARTWNSFGGLLEDLCGAYQIDPACAVAVLCVESSGKGFDRSNGGRMIIRFENHLFWKYWGKYNTAAFHRHFQYGKKDGGSIKVWLGHLWRSGYDGEWQSFHGNQAKEWDVLEFARTLDEGAALLSISMGAPQIMGFNHKKIGYDRVPEMFEKFSLGIRCQIQGFFDFFSDGMIEALKKRDFVRFAGYYNGSGQKEKYGGWIQDHYDAFQNLTVS